MSRLISYRQLKSLYLRSPMWAKRAYAAIPFALRAGHVYRETRQLIAETEYLDLAALEERQRDRLCKLLRHAQQNVPYYREIARRMGSRVSQDRLFDRFHELPLLTKETLQTVPDQFRAASGVGEAAYQDNTGGSSGTPFAFMKNNSMYPIEQAYMMAQWERIGYQPCDRKLTLRGRTFSGLRTGSRWAYNPIYNELVLSSYHLDTDTIAESLKHVEHFRPQFIHGYPSAIVAFLRGIENAGLDMPSGIRAVLCGSEPIYDYQRSYIKRMLGCRAYSWYGQSECVLLAGECERSQEYHSFPLYGVLELVDADGDPISQPGVEGEIVGTSLNNYAMAFIRYRTGDRGVLASPDRCSCGRAHRRLTKVNGRTQYFIYTSRGVAVPVTAFVFGQHFEAFQRICALQLVQDEPGVLCVRIVRGKSYGEADERELRAKMGRSVDQQLRISFEYFDRLPVNAAGKTEFVIQRVDNRSKDDITPSRDSAEIAQPDPHSGSHA